MALATWIHETQMAVPYSQTLVNFMFSNAIRETSDFVLEISPDECREKCW